LLAILDAALDGHERDAARVILGEFGVIPRDLARSA
jgi:hypothetical protein